MGLGGDNGLDPGTRADRMTTDSDDVDSRVTSGIGGKKRGSAYYDLNHGQAVGQKGPDGSVNRVRIVAPRN
jgi:hypothetical protein